ncbi:MAG: YihA family ribosome biogenesis GTP-binding protein [bacterium]|nr:YihA family ribosome biogenesis GTP-binding protein [bacterium]
MNRYRGLVFEKSVVRLEGCPKDRWPEVAFSGRSNVGKSSMLNCLAQRKALAKVSQKPGKTRMLNFFGFPGNSRLVDLPGYGYAKVPESEIKKWRRFMADYLEKREQLAGIVQLIDCRHKPTVLDQQMVGWLRHCELPFLIVLTKSDKIKRGVRNKTVAQVRQVLEMEDDQPVVFFSAMKGEGKREVQSWTDKVLDAWQDPEGR